MVSDVDISKSLSIRELGMEERRLEPLTTCMRCHPRYDVGRAFQPDIPRPAGRRQARPAEGRLNYTIATNPAGSLDLTNLCI
jgi:hypothetical protein